MSEFGVNTGLCFPRSSLATSAARRPRVCPLASTRCHVRTMSFGVKKCVALSTTHSWVRYVSEFYQALKVSKIEGKSQQISMEKYGFFSSNLVCKRHCLSICTFANPFTAFCINENPNRRGKRTSDQKPTNFTQPAVARLLPQYSQRVAHSPLLLEATIMDLLTVSGLDALLKELTSRGYKLVGPTIHDGAIVLDTIHGLDDLPHGTIDDHSPAHYGLHQNTDGMFFGFAAPLTSWKRFLIPPQLTLWKARRSGKGFVLSEPEETSSTPIAMIGVRPCDLRALQIQDAVFMRDGSTDPLYAEARKKAFIVAVQCTTPGGTCFCTSMKSGPSAADGFDLALTELAKNGNHRFLVDVGSERGQTVLANVPTESPSEGDLEEASTAIHHARDSIAKTLATEHLPDKLRAAFDHSQWDDIAKRCLACCNCTMVCPTCFCFTVQDLTDLGGTSAERRRRSRRRLESSPTWRCTAGSAFCTPTCRRSQ